MSLKSKDMVLLKRTSEPCCDSFMNTNMNTKSLTWKLSYRVLTGNTLMIASHF